MDRLLEFINTLSTWVGKAFGWSILILTFGVSYEVFMRYGLNSPTTWSYDIMYMMYGGLFLMAGPYTVSRDAMVRGDFIYRLWRPRTQAIVDLILYLLFYFPGVTALIYAGYHFAYLAWRFGETSIFSPIAIPIYPMKMLIPTAGVLLFLQGIFEVVRCIRCIRDGAWPPRPHDVEELEAKILQEQERKDAIQQEARG